MSNGAVLRLLCNAKYPSERLTDARGMAPFWYRGDDLQIQLSLSVQERYLVAADVGTITVSIKSLDATESTAPLLEREYVSSDCSSSFTGSSDWAAGDDQLLEVFIDRSDVSFAPGTYRMMVIHEASSGRRMTHAVTEIQIKEDYWESPSLSIPPPLSSVALLEDLLERIEDNGDLISAAAGASDVLTALVDFTFEKGELTVSGWTNGQSFTFGGRTITMGTTPTVAEADQILFTSIPSSAVVADVIYRFFSGLHQISSQVSTSYGPAVIGDQLYTSSIDGPVVTVSNIRETVAVSSTGSLFWNKAEIGVSGNNPFLLKTVQTLTSAERLLVWETIFGNQTDIDVPGALTTGAQDLADPESVLNHGQLGRDVFGKREALVNHPVGLYSSVEVGAATSTPVQSSRTIYVAGDGDQSSVEIDPLFASGRFSGISSRFDLLDTVVGVRVDRVLAEDTEVFISAASSGPLAASPVEADKGVFAVLRLTAGVYLADLYYHKGTAATNSSSIGNAITSFHSVYPNRIELRTYKSGSVELWIQTRGDGIFEKAAELTGLTFENIGSGQTEAHVGFRAVAGSSPYTMGLIGAYTIY